MNWDSLPKRIKYVARNLDGSICGFPDKPTHSESFWYGRGEYTIKRTSNDDTPDWPMYPYGVSDWKESLIERPEEDYFTN